MADQFEALRRLFPQQAQQPAASVRRTPVGSVDYSGAFDRLVAEGGVKPKDTGGVGVGDVLSGLGGGLLKALQWADKPRATVVSAYKEAADAGLGKYGLLGLGGLLLGEPPKDAEASWSDFTKQIGENIGAGQVIEEYRPNAPHALKVAGGIAGDVLLDPLTYLTMGSSTVLKPAGKAAARTAVEQLADDALREAVRSGGSKGIARAIINSADTAGFAKKAAEEGGGFVDDAINRLLVDVQKRGAGALTTRGLARSGVTADVAERLGIGSLGKQVFGRNLAGGKLFAELGEGTKGALKNYIRTTKPAQGLRSKFLAPAVKEFYKIAFDEAAPLGKRAGAVIFASTKAESSRLARTWAGQTLRRVGQNFKGVVRDVEGGVDRAATKAAQQAGRKAWADLGVDEAIAATHALEAGGVDELSQVARQEFRQMFDEAKALGVDMGDFGPDYVPHMVTEEARQASRSSAEVKKILESLRDEQGFQKFRALRAGSVLEGEVLQTGTLAEINEIMLRKHGVKLFEDNLQDIMPKYIRSMEKAIERAKQIEVLGQYGFTGPRLEVIVQKLNPDKSWEKELALLRQRRDVLVGEQQVQLRNGFTVRRDGLRQAKDVYESQARELAGRLRKVEQELKRLEGKAAKAEAKVAAVDAKVASWKQTVDGLRKQVKLLQGDQRLQAVKQLREAESQLRVVTREARSIRDVVKKELARLDISPRQLAERTRPLADRRVALQAERDALTAQVKELSDVLVNVSDEMRTTLLATGRQADRALENAKARMKLLLNAKTQAVSEADLAVNAVNIAQADVADVAQLVQRELAVLKPQIDSLTNLPRLSAKQNVTLNLQNEMRERFNTLLQVLNNGNNWDSMGATWRDHAAQQRAIQEFDALGDESIITVFHGTDSETAKMLDAATVIPDGSGVRSNIARPSKGQADALYVSPTYEDALQYGDTVVAFNVRKGDMLPSPEAGQGASSGRAFFNSSAGAIINDGTPIVGRPPSKELKAIAALEAAAAQSDMLAADLGDYIGTLDDMIRITKDKKFLLETQRRTREGMQKLADNLEMPQWMFDAASVDHVLGDISKMPKVLQKYTNLFKAYATMRPGFHVRNAYTALFNMYLEGGVANFANIKKWHEFYRLVEKYPDNYLAKATERFGAETAGKLDDALKVVYGSGSGQYGAAGGTGVFRKATLNPLSEDFRLIQRSRKMGSWVEDHVRGAHAFAVLDRGGSIGTAQDIVEKWHFNYSDLGSWDQAAKNIMPFWTFFSRNLALQAQTYVRNIPRYNRAISNFERNMTQDENDPALVPNYFTKAGAIRISGGKEPRYWFPDLPMTVFPNQVSQLTDIGRLPEFLSQTTPLLKVPLEAAAGKNFYTGAPTKNKYVPVPTGLSQLISLVGGDLPTDVFAQGVDGTPMMKANWAQAMMGALPMMGQIERLAPISEGSLPTGESAFTWLTGLGSKRLTAEQVRNEQYRRMLDQQRAAKLQASLQASLGA